MVLPPNGVLRSIKCPGERFLSMEIREMLLWCGVVKYNPLIQSIKSVEEPTDSQMLIKSHFNRLFPQFDIESTSQSPNMLYVAGGELKIEKFRLLDDMIDMVS